MKQGTWRFNGDTIRFDRDGQLIDGQHRLAALVEFGKPLPMIVVKGFDKETMKTIDQEIKPRNLADLFKMNGVKDAVNVSAVINRFFAISETNSFISTNRTSRATGTNVVPGDIIRRTTIDVKYNEYFSNPDLWDDILSYARRCNKNTRLLRASDIGGVYAFLYLRVHHSDEEIRGFFNRLCFTETDINVINLLRDMLIRDLTSKAPMTGFVKSQYLVKTWNYYIKGKDVKVLSYNKNAEGVIDFIQQLMKLNLIRRADFSFIPASEDDKQAALKIKKGEAVEVSVKVLRNYKFHRKFFSMINTAYGFLTEKQRDFFHDSIDGFRYTLEVAAGYYDEFYSVSRKEWIQKPKSIAFDKMSEAEFDKLYEAVLDVIFKLFLETNRVDRDTFYRALKDF